MQEALKAKQYNRTVRQQEIVDTARSIIISQGIQNLTVREIAAELKITDGALYRHFKSKNEIISLLIEDVEKALLNMIEKAAGSEVDPMQKLENIFFAHLSYAEQRKGVSFILINETLNLQDKSLRKEMYDVVNKYLKTIEVILNQGIELGVFRKDISSNATSFIFWGMIQSIITHWSLSGYEVALKKNLLSEIFSVFKKGIVSRVITQS